jgi:hypothetical protein
MGLGPLGIAAKAGFGSDGRGAAELGRAGGQEVKTGYVDGSGLRRSDVRASGQPALTNRTRPRSRSASARTSVSGAGGARKCVESNSFRPPWVRAQPRFAGLRSARDSRRYTRVDSRNQSGNVVCSGFSQRCCRSVTVLARPFVRRLHGLAPACCGRRARG